ncbi:MAG TPA: AI-2E family transporter [Pirellulaceae bacterium]|jgi:predicted PurR-regulated permease PerM|nr:AI-2E family transporter [Pirellulaceae bacterium]
MDSATESPRSRGRAKALARASARPEWRLFQLVSFVVAIGLAYFARDILVPIALAIFLSFVLAPICDWFERRRVPRALSVVLANCVAAGIILIVLGIAFYQVSQIATDFTKYQQGVVERIRSVRSLVGGGAGALTKSYQDFTMAVRQETDAEPDGDGSAGIETDPDGDLAITVDPKVETDGSPRGDSNQGSGSVVIDEKPSAPVPVVADSGNPRLDGDETNAVPVQIVGVRESAYAQAQALLAPIVEPLGTAGVVIVLSIFILLSRENLRDRIILLLGSSNLHTTTAAVNDATYRVGRYLRMTFVINGGYGVAIGIGCFLFGLPGAIVLGLLAGALRFLPYVGGWLASLLPILLALATKEGWVVPVGVIAMFIVCELFCNTVLEPWLYGASMGVTSIGIIVAAVFWTWLWGPIGLFLAMPLTVCLVVAGSHVPCLNFLTLLLGEEEPMPPHERIYQRLLGFDYEEAADIAKHYLEDRTLAEAYDGLLLPALSAAERDQRAEVLNEEQSRSVFDGLEDLVVELRTRSQRSKKDDDHASEPTPEQRAAACGISEEPTEHGPLFRTLVIPAEDRADEVAAELLATLMESPCCLVERSSSKLLTVETVEEIEREDYDAVVIAVVPPAGMKPARYLCRRLRARRPAMPILVGLFQEANSAATRKLFERDGADVIFAKATEATEQFDKVIQRLTHTDREAAERQAIAKQEEEEAAHGEASEKPETPEGANA